jgi:type I restriction enzyme S subunit
MTDSLPKGWRSVRLADVAEIRFSSVDKKSVAGERAVKLCNYMDVWKNAYIRADMPFMDSTASDADIERFSLQQGDVLLTKDSETREEIAEPSVVREPVEDLVLGYHLALIRPRPETVDGLFLAAQLRIPQFRSQFVRAAAGATRYGLSLNAVESGSVWLPPLPEQRRIAEILSAVDDAIAAARAVIDQTRRLKTALLHHLITHGLPGRHSTFRGVAGIGEIPADWEAVRLDQIADVERGKFTHRPRNEPRLYGGQIPFVQTSDVVNSGDYLRTHSQTLNAEGLKVSRIFPAGTILIVIAGSVGAATIASYDVAFPDSVVGITPRAGIESLFLLRTIQHAYGRICRTATESAQANINLELLRPLPLPLPPADERDAIMRLLRSVEERIEAGEVDLQQAWAVKSALSQALLTGRVSAAHQSPTHAIRLADRSPGLGR